MWNEGNDYSVCRVQLWDVNIGRVIPVLLVATPLCCPDSHRPKSSVAAELEPNDSSLLPETLSRHGTTVESGLSVVEDTLEALLRVPVEGRPKSIGGSAP